MNPPFYIYQDNVTDGDIVERQRHDCRNRGQCLNVAIERRQEVFACIQPDGAPCPSYRQMSIKELHSDVEPLLELVGTILHRPRSKIQLH